MHYILLAIALNLGKENVQYMKVADMSNHKKNEIHIANKKDYIKNVPFLDIEDETFSEPFITSDEFAELLPEDELGNIIFEEEEQGPKFIKDIKKKLIEVIENKDSKKEIKTVIGSQVEGPSFIDNIKSKFSNKNKEEEIDIVLASQIEGVNFIEKIKNTTEDITDKVETSSFIDKIKDTSIKVGSKVKETTLKTPSIISDLTKKTFTKKEVKKDEVKKSNVIIGTLFDSELNNALNDKQNLIEQKSILDRETLSDIEIIKYEENEDYQNFLNEKEISSLVKPEKILIPNIIPRKKEIVSYKDKSVPEELLKSRSFQNKHIPKIMLNKDREVILEKIIEYGMLPEFRAFMNDLRDANLTMNNQYTLLTYATKYKQYKIMSYLIHIGGDINKRDDRLDTPLTIAVQNNDMRAVKIITNANADLDMSDIIKRTPLIYSIEKNQEQMAIYLIENGADINIPNGVGEGTLSMSVRLGRNLIKEKIIKILQEKQNEK